eukprot:884114-Pelagomonas_calceolata.AAC.1
MCILFIPPTLQAIVGGGLGGLALAAGLQERGFDVQLFEAAPELRTATSTLIGGFIIDIKQQFKVVDIASVFGGQCIQSPGRAHTTDYGATSVSLLIHCYFLWNQHVLKRQEGVQAKQIVRVEIRAKDSLPQVTTQDPPTKLMTFRWAKVVKQYDHKTSRLHRLG